MADQYTIHCSEADIEKDFLFTSKQYSYVNDSNSGQYPSGIIQFDLASLSNSNRWIDWSNSKLVIPLVMCVHADQQDLFNNINGNQGGLCYAASLKNGIWNIIHSMSIELTNNQIVNLTPYSGLHITYTMETSCSQDTMKNYGDSVHFANDSAASVKYVASQSNIGIGETNNTIQQQSIENFTDNWCFPYNVTSGQNLGRLQRMMNTSNDIDYPWNPFCNYSGSAQTKTSLTNYCDSGTSSMQDIIYYITATIDLKILHDVFAKMPMIKCGYLRLTINTNCGSVADMTVQSPFQNFTILASNDGGQTYFPDNNGDQPLYPVTNTPGQFMSGGEALDPYLQPPASTNDNPTSGMFLTCNVSSPNNVFPCEISPIGQGLPLQAKPLTKNTFNPQTGSLHLALDIAKSRYGFSHVLGQCRLYATMYEFTPALETRYLSSVGTKRILYNDILSFQSLNTPPGGTNNQILTVGVARPRYLLGVPMLTASVNGSSTFANGSFVPVPYRGGLPVPVPMNYASAHGDGGMINYFAGQQSPFSVMSSPFSSIPGTASPMMRLSNFNVLMSGVNIYQENLNYGFLEFQTEVRESNALNGGLDFGLSSGTISQSDWELLYGYIYVDLGRRLSSQDDNVARSIQVQYTNNTKVPMDVYWFCCFEREIAINVGTGALVL